jgi:hypothetical protein
MLKYKQNFEAIFYLHMSFSERIRDLVISSIIKSLLGSDVPEAKRPPSKYLRMTRNQITK